jgi:hypothetical protein
MSRRQLATVRCFAREAEILALCFGRRTPEKLKKEHPEHYNTRMAHITLQLEVR